MKSGGNFVFHFLVYFVTIVLIYGSYFFTFKERKWKIAVFLLA